jgi:chorismate lyase / 3-hydroxybenzoate synthase
LNDAKPAFGVEYRSRAQLPALADRWWHGALGVAQFGPDVAPLELAQVPIAVVPLSPLRDAGTLYEIWRADGPMHVGNCGRVKYRATAQLLFGCISVPDRPQVETAGAALEADTRTAYAQIFATLEASGYRQVVRIWNYVADLGQPDEAGERYWLFNDARHHSFIASGRPVVTAVPAASALGTPRGSPLVIYFLANRSTVQMLENPRQVSAYRYPTQYGPRSPAFSRAALLAEGGGTLMISGTASIVGHETVHAGDVTAQTRESLINIAALTDDASRRLLPQRFALETLAYKVYVRNEADLPDIIDVMQATVGRTAPVAYMRADICRRDLLVEIEAVGNAQPLVSDAQRTQLACAAG